MKIALLLPTRDRMNLKLTFLLTALARCKDPNNFTVYFGMDADDPTLDRCKKLAKVITNLKIVEFEPQGPKTNIHTIWNKLAEVSTEEIISMVGDDMMFSSDNWDEKILEEFTAEKCPDKFKLVCGNDGFRKDKFPSWLFIHRYYCEVTGKFMRDEFVRNWVDQWLDQIYLAFNRKVFRPDITITHNHWVFNAMQKDRVAMGLEQREGPNKELSDKLWPKLGPERVKEVEMWSKVLGLTPDLSKVDH
jgi:hypothetical protein